MSLARILPAPAEGVFHAVLTCGLVTGAAIAPPATVVRVHGLEQLHEWPVDNAAGAVVSGGTVTATAGDPDRVYDLASVTKPLVAYAALIAVEEGAIELAQAAGPPGSTVRHLLAHTSGLAFKSAMVQAAPGKRRIYSSYGFGVLADFISAQTGIAFADYLRDAVTVPLGMAATGLPGHPGHGARSSVTDLTRFLLELAAPTLISRETWAEATAVQFPGRDGVLPGYGTQRPNDWGLGVEIRGTKSPHWTGTRNSPQTFGHFGQSGTFLWVDPDAGKSCVVLTDRAFGEWAIPLWPRLSDAVLAGAQG